jgi:hypothetical protein
LLPVAAFLSTERVGSPADLISFCRFASYRACSVALFLTYCEDAFDAGELQFFSSLELLHIKRAFLRYLAPLRKTEWVVYAKAPFAGPEEVLRYVAQYTHRVAISNNRLLDLEDGKVRFRWRDYRDNNRHKTMQLAAEEFIRRFLLHVLPEGFQRIRYYGFLAKLTTAAMFKGLSGFLDGIE